MPTFALLFSQDRYFGNYVEWPLRYNMCVSSIYLNRKVCDCFVPYIVLNLYI